jgi:hypothetical protein
MANGMGILFGMFLVSAIIFIYFLVTKIRKAKPAPGAVLQTPLMVEKSGSAQPARLTPPPHSKPIQPVPSLIPPEANRGMAVKNSVGKATASVKSSDATATAVAAPSTLPVRIDLHGAFAASEDRRDQILATISENIRKSLTTRQAVQSSPIPYSESKTRNTEYVRVKKEIITPHDQIRFSILKDWVSTNMLAIFRRASFDWKTPEDLVALLPEYLAAEAEILNGQVLLLGTYGHDEKLAVPIRALDEESSLRECFDFVTDVRTVTNTPAVLRTSDAEFEVVSRGVITRALFTNAIEQGQQWHMKLLVDRSPEELQKNYPPSLRQIESAVAADTH